MITKTDEPTLYKRQIGNGINGICFFAQSDGESTLCDRYATGDFAIERVWLDKAGAINTSGGGKPGIRFRLLSKEEKDAAKPEPVEEKAPAPAEPSQGEYEMPEEVKKAMRRKAVEKASTKKD